MKSKNLILSLTGFIFGLFLFLLPNFAEAGLCEQSCVEEFAGIPGEPTGYCGYKGGTYITDRLGTIGYVKQNPMAGNHMDFCVSSAGECKNNAFPSGNNGQDCTAVDFYWNWVYCTWWTSSGGVWDSYESKCVTCDWTSHTEANVLGYISSKYCNDGSNHICAYNGDTDGDAGDGQCESACGASSQCDEKTPGASCGTGKECNNSCQCVTVCVCTSNTVGGCCDGCSYCPAGQVNNGAGTCVTPSSTYHCNSWENCDNSECSATRRWYGCTGTSETCSASLYQEEAVTASNGKVLRSDCSEVSPSTSYYCDYYENCSSGGCSADEYYRACNGSGSCRTDNTYAYHVDVIASAGHSLTSSCGTSGSTLCDSTWRASSGTGDNHYGKGGAYSCQGMCDGSGDCEYAVNCEGICSGTLDISISGSGTCTVTASLSATGCNGLAWQVKDSGGATKCSGTVSGSPYSTTCSNWTVGVGTHTYNLYIGGLNKDSDAVTCSETPNEPPTCDYLWASPDSGNAPLGVSFTASGSDSDGTIVQYEFDFGDGSSKVYSSTAGTNHTYNTASTYCAKLRVQDDNGAWSTNTGNCPGGICTAQIMVTEAGAAINPPQVRTVPISEKGTVNTGSATFWGELTNMGGTASCLVWFEYKKSTDTLWTKACEAEKYSTGYFACDLAGLASNTTYDFEAFAKNGGSW